MLRMPDPRDSLRFTITLLIGGAAASVLAFTYLGWFGVGMVGLLGLWFANDFRFVRQDEDGDIAYPDHWRTPYSDRIYEQARRNYERELAASGTTQDEVAAARAHLRYLKNTVFLALFALGFGMVFVQG